MRAIVFILCLINLFAGCKSKDDVPSGILNFQNMQAVMWDVIQAEALTAQLIKKDSSINAPLQNLKLQQQIFAEHQTNKAAFYKSYQYYSGNVQLMRRMLDSITTVAERNKYKNLYNKPPLPERISLMPLPALPQPAFIPMPVPSLNPAKTVLPDTLPFAKKQLIKPLSANQQP
jgi:Domain of unknown function (DUF4296)